MASDREIIAAAKAIRNFRHAFAQAYGNQEEGRAIWAAGGQDREIARAALAAVERVEEPREPSGWKLVPVEPTEAMLSVHASPMLRIGDPDDTLVQQWRSAVYRSMLAAAPLPPVESETDAARSEGYRAGMMRASVIIASAKSNGWDVTATINRALESIRAEADKLERGEGE